MKYFLLVCFISIIGCHSAIQYPEGGYKYPKIIAPLDLHQYHYPIKDIVSKRDSFRNSYAYLFYEPFDEPNISLKPQSLETFRLTYWEALGTDVIIVLNKNGISVKRGHAGRKYSDHEDSLLSETQRNHYWLLKLRFPIDTLGKDSSRKQYLRTLLTDYPQLLDPFYYKMLFEKSLASYEMEKTKEISYIESKVSISKSDFINWVQELNASGYWTLPPEIDNGGDAAMDNDSFLLEANTTEKYNYVEQLAFSNDTSKFAKACQSLINLAGMGKEIHVAVNHLEDKK